MDFFDSNPSVPADQDKLIEFEEKMRTELNKKYVLRFKIE